MSPQPDGAPSSEQSGSATVGRVEPDPGRPPAVRASDADREATVTRLQRAVAEGRIDPVGVRRPGRGRLRRRHPRRTGRARRRPAPGRAGGGDRRHPGAGGGHQRLR
ncbi:MAG: DUF1707 domain-containing protein [Actinomycetota bacterium]|nr:DUF1707 domain-containing protein [Actinomycetota bacterium]